MEDLKSVDTIRKYYANPHLVPNIIREELKKLPIDERVRLSRLENDRNGKGGTLYVADEFVTKLVMDGKLEARDPEAFQSKPDKKFTHRERLAREAGVASEFPPRIVR